MMAADGAHAAAHQPKAKIFISYSRKDMPFADRLEAALKSRGFDVLIDREEIYAFEDWWKRLQALISSADTVVFVLSPDAVASREALREVDYAASLNKRFAPIVCRRVDDAAVPQALRQLNFIFFNESGQFDDSASKLVEALQTNIVWIRDHTKFGEAAHGWAVAGRPNGLLLRTPALEMAEYWIASRPGGAPEPAEETRTFILASRQGARSAQQLRRVAVGSIFLLMFAVILALVGWINQNYLFAQWHWWIVTRPYAAEQVWPYVLTEARELALKPGNSFKECATDCPQMLLIPAGSFMMGLPASAGLAAEMPQHNVSIPKSFAISKYEVTFADWDACVAGGGCDGYRPDDEGWGRGKQPVINVNWDDAKRYAMWLSLVTGKTYRLLSESEYEYATRAGTTTTYPWGNDVNLNGQAMANCSNCGAKRVSPVPAGSFQPNKFGLYDMVGNVWEWVEDCAHGNFEGAPADGSAWMQSNGGNCSERHLRGGSFLNAPNFLGSAIRFWLTAGDRNFSTGFRVARSLPTR